MNDQSHIGFVNTHSKGDGGYDNIHFFHFAFVAVHGFRDQANVEISIPIRVIHPDLHGGHACAHHKFERQHRLQFQIDEDVKGRVDKGFVFFGGPPKPIQVAVAEIP